MDFDKILSHYKAKACVMSVELFPDGSYGNIRVVAGNKAPPGLQDGSFPFP